MRADIAIVGPAVGGIAPGIVFFARFTFDPLGSDFERQREKWKGQKATVSCPTSIGSVQSTIFNKGADKLSGAQCVLVTKRHKKLSVRGVVPQLASYRS